MENRTYIAIDLKSFYASVECIERGLDPLGANLVVADASRTEKTICLAVSPSLKAHGISGRARLFEVVQRVKEVNAERLRKAPGHKFTGSSYYAAELKESPELSLDYVIAPPQMAHYMCICRTSGSVCFRRGSRYRQRHRNDSCQRFFYTGGMARYRDFDGWVASAIDKLNQGRIQDRYYGIFIDEVQAFESEWYKFCYNLLENKNSKDHIFVICGDKTQRLDKLKKRGQAPWQVGEGYPSYRGGNKNIRIEKNYRNCIEINEYINRYVSNAKQYLYGIQEDYEIDPDMFLRGQAVFHG